METKFTSILSKVEAGQVITVYGRTFQDATYFAMELNASVDGDRSEIPFYISVRYTDSPKIVRCSKTKDVWGEEEESDNLIQGNVANPIAKGVDFKIAIYIDVDMFFVTIDDKPYCTFQHRQYFGRIKSLNVFNDVESIYQVEHTSAAQQNRWPRVIDTTVRLSVPKKCKPGDVIVIGGATHGSDAGSFALNICDEELKRPLFHMRVNLGTKSFKVNSQCENNYWLDGFEVVPESFPFEINEQFKIAIAFQEECFGIFANGKCFCNLSFRDTSERIFKCLNGIEFLSRGGTIVDVKSFDCYECSTADIESFAAEKSL